MAEKIGNAYLEVTPKVSPNFGQDIKQQTSGIGESAGTDLGSKFGGGFAGSMKSFVGAGAVAVGNILANMAQQALAAVGDLFANAFNNYADYEQLVGGVDTLFKESSATVQAYAAQAYATSGMSANQYMEQVTSFSASLLQGLGGDTEAAAKYADTAMRDMSDNANKMGTSMEAITNAYQGFAKQNYTMLDNLKLGYGGTKSEMERLLADASKIAGVEFDIDNYSDVIQAIHVMQEEMGIAGTTAKEAQETISGSIGMLSASWQNFLTGVFDENADMGALGEQLFTSLGAVLKNVIPRLGVLAGRAIMDLPGAIASAIESIPDILAPTLQKVFGDEMGNEIGESIGRVTSTVSGALNRIIAIIQSVLEKVLPIVQPVLDAVMAVVDAAMPVIEQAIDTVLTFLETNVLPIVQMVMDTVMPIVEAISAKVAEVAPVIMSIVSGLMSGIQSVIGVVMPIVQSVVEVALSAITVAFDTLAPIGDFVSGVFNGIKSAMEDPVNTAKSVIEGAVNAIKGFFNFSITWPHIPLPHFSISPAGWGIGDLLKGSIPHLDISWYAKGGYVDGATLIGAGERGGELIWPSYEPYLTRYAEAIANAGGGGNSYTINVDGSAILASPMLENSFMAFMEALRKDASQNVR